MNYIELIRGFWRSHEEHSFTPTEIAVYFYLVEICNICQWKNPFKRNNAKIGADLGISFNTLKNARNKLQQVGLITFKTTNGSPNVIYTLSKFDKVSDEVDVKVTTEVSDEVDVKVLPTKDKLNINQTKHEELISPPIPPKGIDYFELKITELNKSLDEKDAILKSKEKELEKYEYKLKKEKERKKTPDISFVDFDFRDVFSEWLAYKQDRGEKYRSERSLKACYTELVKKSSGDPETAKLIIQQSMANNWAGLFELKNRKGCKNGQSKQSGINEDSGGADRKLYILEKAARAVAELGNQD